MQFWSAVEQVPAGFGPSVVTIGNFDGVHRGHQEVLGRVVARARAAGMASVAVTFDPHPSQVHRPESAPELLTGTSERVALIAQTGIDAVLVLPYSLQFARQSPEEFVTRYLVDPLGVRRVVVGHDVRFGWQNAGDLDTMIALGHAHGFEVEAVSDLGQAQDDGGSRDGAGRWSSTIVRGLLGQGAVEAAAELLGRHHSVTSVVVHGDARGRTLGFPTANLAFPLAGFVPADGVYAGWAEFPGASVDSDRRLPAAISIGTNPTFDGVEPRVEAYVLDRTDLDLYGQEVRLEFVARLRDTLKFESIDELVMQMTADVDSARRLLKS